MSSQEKKGSKKTSKKSNDSGNKSSNTSYGAQGSTGDPKNKREGLDKKTDAQSGSSYDASKGKSPSDRSGTEFKGNTSTSVNARGDSGNQNRLSQQQRAAAQYKDARNINPGDVHDAIISERGIAYNKSEDDTSSSDKK